MPRLRGEGTTTLALSIAFPHLPQRTVNSGALLLPPGPAQPQPCSLLQPTCEPASPWKARGGNVTGGGWGNTCGTGRARARGEGAGSGLWMRRAMGRGFWCLLPKPLLQQRYGHARAHISTASVIPRGMLLQNQDILSPARRAEHEKSNEMGNVGQKKRTTGFYQSSFP